MHVSADTFEKCRAESHAQQFLIYLRYFLRPDHQLYTALFHDDQLVHDNTVDQCVKYAEYDTVGIGHRYLKYEYCDIQGVQHRCYLPA